MTLQKFNEIKKEVRLANPNLNDYGVIYISKIVYQASKNEVNQEVEEVIDFQELKNDFWDCHKQQKRITSDSRRCEKSAILTTMVKISKIFVENNKVEEYFGKFSDYVIKTSKSEVKSNSHGRKNGYLTYVG